VKVKAHEIIKDLKQRLDITHRSKDAKEKYQYMIRKKHDSEMLKIA